MEKVDDVEESNSQSMTSQSLTGDEDAIDLAGQKIQI